MALAQAPEPSSSEPIEQRRETSRNETNDTPVDTPIAPPSAAIPPANNEQIANPTTPRSAAPVAAPPALRRASTASAEWSAASVHTAAAPPQTYFEKLRAGDKDWIPKGVLRVVALLAAVIGIGCSGAVLNMPFRTPSDSYYLLDDTFGISLAIGGFSVSFVWSAIVILVALLRRPPRPVHPGIAVGADLVLWLYMVICIGSVVVGMLDLSEYGTDGTISDIGYPSNYRGEYVLTDDNQWVYNITKVFNNAPSTSTWDPDLGKWVVQQPPVNINETVRDCSDYFPTCEAQDEWVNAAWRGKPTAVALERAAIGCMGLLILLHFVLFVWACVDTHRRRQRKRAEVTRGVAMDIIADLEQRGLIVVNREARNQIPLPPPPAAQVMGNGENVRIERWG